MRKPDLLAFGLELAAKRGIPQRLVEPVVELYCGLQRSCRSNAIRDGIRSRRAIGRRHSRHAGYGFQWDGGKRVANEAERQIMAGILEKRREGFSWSKIARHLLLANVTTFDGGEWSASRVRRACLAEIALRRTEEGRLP